MMGPHEGNFWSASLRNLFDGNVERFSLWLRDFYKGNQNNGNECTKCLCRHAKLRPPSEELCKGWGTKDAPKGNAIRKSTVWTAACKFQGKPQCIAEVTESTKIRAIAISFLGCWTDVEDFKVRWQKYTEPTTVLKHRCGCGVPSGEMATGCTNGEHLVAGTQSENRDETVFHELLIRCGEVSGELYNQQVKIFEQLNKRLF